MSQLCQKVHAYFIRDLRLITGEYNVSDNCTITKEELANKDHYYYYLRITVFLFAFYIKNRTLSIYISLHCKYLHIW